MVGKRVQMLPTTRDEDRLAKSLEERAPDRVYILYNQDPLAIHDDLNESVTETIEEVVEKKTMCGERDEVEKVGIDFYRFNEALVDSFRLIYRESERGNDVLVNVSGGTKPVAIALTFACSLVDNGQPLYYVADHYPDNESQGDSSSNGVVDTPFKVGPLQGLDISYVLPDDDEDRKNRLLRALLEVNKPTGVADLLAYEGVIEPEPPESDPKSNERESRLQAHYRPASLLSDDNIINKTDGGYELTDSGEVVARLVQARTEVNKQLDNSRSES